MFSWGQNRYKGWEADGKQDIYDKGVWRITLTDPDGKFYDYGSYRARSKKAAAKKRIRALLKHRKEQEKIAGQEGKIIF